MPVSPSWRSFSFALAALAGCTSSSQGPAPSPPRETASAVPVAASSSVPVVASAPPPPASSSAVPVASASAPPAAPEAPPGMAIVPAGAFPMGQDDLGEMDERPAHKVTLKAFFLDLTEVTNEAYNQCVDKGVCRHHDVESARINKVGEDKQFRRPKQPISAISHEDARTYCKFVGKRLPTEAEWEKASRGEEGRMFPWGSEFPTHEHAVFGEATTADVGSKPKGKGPYGHLDLAGNVWEWVEDMYDPFAYRRDGKDKGIPGTCEQIMETQTELRRSGKQGFTGSNPIPAECERVLRGGAFQYHAKGLRSSNRVHHPGTFRLIMSGFRCAKDAE